MEEAGLLELCTGAELAAWRVALLRAPRPGGAPEPEPAPEVRLGRVIVLEAEAANLFVNLV